MESIGDTWGFIGKTPITLSVKNEKSRLNIFLFSELGLGLE